MPIYFQLTSSSLPISLESIGNQWPQPSIKRPHGYPYYHWLQTEQGCGEVFIADKRILLTPGQGVLIAPFIPHTYSPVTEWQTNFATFKGGIVTDFLNTINIQSYIQTEDSTHFSFSDWINQMIDNHQKNALTDSDLSVACYQFLLYFHQNKPQELCHIPSEQEKYLLPIIHEIETNYAEQLSIEILAKKNYISHQYLNRIFRQQFHKSPYQYLIDFRLNKSKELLISQPELTIQEISFSVGFQSPSQFIALFKKKTAFTPKQFRKLYC
ncbi:AraC-like DNA-binding protein [Enterococcus sp. PF1-24]|uniref:AraC family transcriptional regulator n=1 Tax=unclassified Enterococcus TaxID=2608891 RepID=UPI002473FB25|nr:MULTISPECIES: AraC family transcriptional regulator [unclassified Enterococcus]MDH6363969.1 AraC-like DNA-binding protein [Enterococcus sp. PFB1-1]MDH6401070.1 AraC-like DNA-binding protein [Enterococcus sp. PF1-24]